MSMLSAPVRGHALLYRGASDATNALNRIIAATYAGCWWMCSIQLTADLLKSYQSHKKYFAITIIIVDLSTN